MHRGKVDPGVSELPRGSELSRDHVNRPLDLKTFPMFSPLKISVKSIQGHLDSLNFIKQCRWLNLVSKWWMVGGPRSIDAWWLVALYYAPRNGLSNSSAVSLSVNRELPLPLDSLSLGANAV